MTGSFLSHDRLPGALVLTALLGIAPVGMAAQELPSASDVLAEAGYSADQRSQVLAGKFVSGDVHESSDREIALSLAFLIRGPDTRLVKEFISDRMEHLDPSVTASGQIRGKGSLGDFQALRLKDKSEVNSLLDAEPGEAVNFSAQELARFREVRLGGDADPRDAVQQLLRQLLLTRYREYRAGGLDAIAPYDRGDGNLVKPGQELASATRAPGPLEPYESRIFQALLGYPKTRSEEMTERFYWSRYDLDDQPTFVLTQLLAMKAGKQRALVERQYYVSRSYNSEQAVLSVWPVKEGTLVLYVNRISTDRAAGIGSSVRHSLGRKMMRDKLEALYRKLQSYGA